MSEPKSFAGAMDRLEEIVTLLESGEAGLEQSMALFEEGVQLTRLCERQLASAKQKITTLSQAEAEADHGVE